MSPMDSYKQVYFLGIGGIGMSALARYFKALGATVSGYDKTPSDITDALQAEGIHVTFVEQPVPDLATCDLLVYTPAIPHTHPAFEAALQQGKHWHKRAEVLGWISASTRTLAVAGTHGKTTTTAISTHLLVACGAKVNAFVGGVMQNQQSNLVLSPNAKFTVAEADEFDRSFLNLNPAVAIITSTDADHLDVYGTQDNMLEAYRQFAAKAEALVVNERCAHHFQHKNKLIYGNSAAAQVRFQGTDTSSNNFSVEFANSDRHLVNWPMAGAHNAENAAAALAAAHLLGFGRTQLVQALANFKGVKRRFEWIISTGPVLLVDDYAHHPTEINAAISAMRQHAGDRKLTVVFQPHLFSRTRDFELEFAQALACADELILLPIYPARELPIEGVSSDHLLSKVPLKTRLVAQKADLVKTVLSLSPEIVLMLGAGDIDRLVQPMKEALLNYPVQ